MKKLFVLAASAAMILASCAKDGGENTPGGKTDSAEGRLSVSFAVPSTMKTRADQDASTGEWEVKSVTVFLFNSTSGAALSKPAGGIADFGISAFTPSSEPATNSTVYTLKSDNLIETLSGNANIYVGVNLPAAVRNKEGGYANETALKAAIAELADLDGTTAGQGMAMITEAQLVELLASPEDAQEPTVTELNDVKVGRIVSKLAASFDPLMPAVEWTSGVTLTYSIKNYGVYSAAVKSFVGKAATTEGTRRTYAQSLLLHGKTVYSGIIDQATDPGKATLAGLDNTHYYYICENAPATVGGSTVSNSTYAYVSTTVDVSETAVMTGEWEDGAWTEVPTWGGPAYTAAPGTELFVIVDQEGKHWITADLTVATKIADALGTNPDGEEATAQELEDGTATDLPIYVYTDGYVHFPVFLNPDKAVANNYIIGRNQFIHLKINKVLKVDNTFTGNPGIPATPNLPMDPEDTNGNLINGHIPDEPIDGYPANLEVEFEVAPWLYIENSVDLKR